MDATQTNNVVFTHFLRPGQTMSIFKLLNKPEMWPIIQTTLLFLMCSLIPVIVSVLIHVFVSYSLLLSQEQSVPTAHNMRQQ